MSNTVATTTAEAARLITANKLKATSILVENTPADAAADQPTVNISVGEEPRAVLAWARYLKVDTVLTDRRVGDATLKVHGVKDGITWSVFGSYGRSLTQGARNRYPGVTVNWERREVSGSRTGRGTITVGQLEVLIGALGV